MIRAVIVRILYVFESTTLRKKKSWSREILIKKVPSPLVHSHSVSYGRFKRRLVDFLSIEYWTLRARNFTSAHRNSHDHLRTKPEPHPHPSETSINSPFHGYLHLLKAIHGKERSRKRDWRSHLGIELDTSRIEGRAITNCTNPCPQKQVKAQSSAVECLPDTVSIVFPKIEWHSLTSASWQGDHFFSFSLFLLHDEKDIETSLKDARCDQNYDQSCVTHTSISPWCCDGT